MIPDEDRWNHNIHYYPVILDAVPEGGRRALVIGCGEGLLTRKLCRLMPEVIGIDLHGPSLELARQQDPDGVVEYVQDDFRTHDFALGSFDLVASVATLHHMDAVAGLERMRTLPRPGGTLAVVGLARGSIPADLPYELAAAVAHLRHRLTKRNWEHPSPVVWPPPESWASMRHIAVRVLPGARFRRHLMWRYSLIWQKPR